MGGLSEPRHGRSRRSARDATLLVTRGWRLLRLGTSIFGTWLWARLSAPAVASPEWRRLVTSSSVRSLAAVAVDVEIRGARPLLEGPVLVVANHVSWLDVQALGTIAPTRFVAKSEVRGWPGIGDLVARVGTLFLVRRSCRDAARVKNLVARDLVSGDRFAVFPEGTTTDGSRVDRFYPALLQAAVDAAVPVQPVAIRYRELDGARSAAAAFVDDMTFGGSLARVLARPRLVAELTFGPPIYAADKTRRALAAQCQAFIAGTLGVEAPAAPASRPRHVTRRAA
jgi:1-acyl-sn-glycerol-3-phosphate acyltransferase